MKKILSAPPRKASWRVSAIPLLVLAVTFILIIAIEGPLAVSDYSPYALLGSAVLAFVLSAHYRYISRRSLVCGLRRSATQILPAIPMLICIAALATTWMLSGVIPTLVEYGLLMLNPHWFLVTACAVCAMVSVITGSSWSTIATIGVAFLGIGTAMGYAPGWTAGAIISGAYFGDKVSPLSDTTVIASSTCGVDLFTHIRYMMITTTPAMAIALLVFAAKGLMSDGAPIGGSIDMLGAINSTFNITPWVLLIPVLTLTLIALKVPTITVLATSAVLAGVGVFIFQPQLGMSVMDVVSSAFTGYTSTSGVESVDRLISTGGIFGILPVVYLVTGALIFGWIMIGSGMLASVAEVITRKLQHRVSIIAATLATGFTMNATTADQYLSIIISGNIYRNLFKRKRMEQRLLSRTLEDGVSVTSPIIPWSSCGVTQATVLGVPTITYLPYCIFNYLTPIVSLFIVSTGFKIKQAVVSSQTSK